MSGNALELKAYAEQRTRAYLRFELNDVAGALAKVTGVLAQHDISILALTDFMRGRPLPGAMPKGELVPVVILTGEALVSDIDKALEACMKLPEVGPNFARFRVEKMREDA